MIFNKPARSSARPQKATQPKGYRRTGKRYSKEDTLQHDILHALSMIVTKGFFYHINNSGKTDSERIRNAYLGVLPGVADIHVVWPRGHGYIEVKTPDKNSKQSLVQKDFQKTCEKMKIPYSICRSVDDAIDFVKKNKIPHRMSRLQGK